MTKKEFKEKCSFHKYYGRKTKINAIFFDWQSGFDENGKSFCGYKYMVKSNVKNISSNDLFNLLYDWVNQKIISIPYYVDYKFAENDSKRFKVPLIG